MASGSNNGVDPSPSATEFHFVPPPHVLKLEPTVRLGSASTVTVYGSHFTQMGVLTCKFGRDVLVPAVWLTSTSLECAVRRNLAGTVTVEISNNGVEFTNTGLKSVEIPAYVAKSLNPSVGPVQGGSIVTIQVADLCRDSQCPSVSDVVCHFGDRNVSSVSVTMTSLSCVSPMMPRASQVELQVEIGGNRMIASNHSLRFTYLMNAVIRTRWPSVGPVTGGTILSMSGMNFPKVADWLCMQRNAWPRWKPQLLLSAACMAVLPCLLGERCRRSVADRLRV